MYDLLYIEINLFCVCILVLLLHKARLNYRRQTEQLLFSNVTLNGVLLLFLDFLWILLDGKSFPGAYEILTLINAGYFVETAVLAWGWFSYIDYCLGHKIHHHSLWRKLSLVPMVALIVLSVASIWTGWIFSVDDFNHYHRGELYLVQPLLVYIYLFWAMAMSLAQAFKRKNYAERNIYLSLFTLGFFPLVASLLQTLLPGVPLLAVGMTLAILMVFVSIQAQMISVDPLTGLNNRLQFYKFLSKKMVAARPAIGNLYLFVLDADDFKHINDTYGHGEGDNALQIMANVLKRVCGPRNCFIARYGGDEFVVAGEFDSEETAKDLVALIDESLKEASSSMKYPLKMSVGYAEYSDDMEIVPDFFNKADAALYQVKEARHSER